MIDRQTQDAIDKLREADAALAVLEETIRAKRGMVANALHGFDSMDTAPLELTAEMEPSASALAQKISGLTSKAGNSAPPAKQRAK